MSRLGYWLIRLALELIVALVIAKLVTLMIGWDGRDAGLFILFTAVPAVIVFWLSRWNLWVSLFALLIGSVGYLLLALLAGSIYAPGAVLILIMPGVLLLALLFGRQMAVRKSS